MAAVATLIKEGCLEPLILRQGRVLPERRGQCDGSSTSGLSDLGILCDVRSPGQHNFHRLVTARQRCRCPIRLTIRKNTEAVQFAAWNTRIGKVEQLA